MGPSGGTVTDSVEFRGCRISYQRRGEGPPVLMIQGVGVHGDGWLPQVEGLRRRFDCLTFDNRGMGESQPPAGEITIESMTQDALALMDRLGWESAHMLGHSMGGLIAQRLALTAPERVRSLALLCTVSRGSDATSLKGRMLWLGIGSSVGPRAMRRRVFLRIVMPPSVLADADEPALAARLAPIFGHDLADRAPVTMKQLAALRAYDSTPRLPELARFPTLVVSAEHDPIAPPARGRALAAGISGARFVEFADSAHGVTIQRADEVNALLTEHFLEAERRRGGPA